MFPCSVFFSTLTAKVLSFLGLLFPVMIIFTPAHAQQVLHVSAISDEAPPTELQRKVKPLGHYLEKKLGVQIAFTPVTDYAALRPWRVC